MSAQARFFDGKTSRRHAVTVSLRDDVITIAGDVDSIYYLHELQVPERVRRASRKLTFPDGATLEMEDDAGYHALVSAAGYRDPVSIKLLHNWRGALLAAVILIAVLVPGYLYGLPAAASMIAKRMPESAQRAIGRETLTFLDKSMLAPSSLPPARQEALADRFRVLMPPKYGMPSYEVLFRKSKIGPNAFALPSGQIVMTDELVKLLDNDDAVMGVLAHELGHLHERHLLRRIIQGSAVGLVTMVLFGDVSWVVTAIPTTMLDLKYSRDAEREADEYAIAMMKANGISLAGLRLTFEKLGKKSDEMSVYLSSHPPTAERMERVKRAE